MRIVNIHQAKTNLSQLIARTVDGEPFIIAKAGRPLVKVVRLDTAASKPPQRLGFLAGQFEVPDDFDRMGSAEIAALFGIGE